MQSGTISREQFDKDIAELAEKSRGIGSGKYQWILIKHDYGLFCKHSCGMVWKDEVVVREFHVTYNDAYQVPVLWFNFYRNNGSLLELDAVLELISKEHRGSVESELSYSLSQNEHPHLGIAFYHIHPCRTSQVMKDVHYSNYVLSWLSIYGSLLRLPLPKELFI